MKPIATTFLFLTKSQTRQLKIVTRSIAKIYRINGRIDGQCGAIVAQINPIFSNGFRIRLKHINNVAIKRIKKYRLLGK